MKGSKMRITLTIEDTLAKALKIRAIETGKSFGQVVNETLSNGLQQHAVRKLYRVKPASLGMPLRCLDLDKVFQLVDELEDVSMCKAILQASKAGDGIAGCKE